MFCCFSNMPWTWYLYSYDKNVTVEQGGGWLGVGCWRVLIPLTVNIFNEMPLTRYLFFIHSPKFSPLFIFYLQALTPTNICKYLLAHRYTICNFFTFSINLFRYFSQTFMVRWTIKKNISHSLNATSAFPSYGLWALLFLCKILSE